MRLGQLSRRISVRSYEIVQFLDSQGIKIEDGVNTKVEDAHLKLVIDRFAPGLALEKETEQEPVAEVRMEEISPVQEQVVQEQRADLVVEPIEEPQTIVEDVVTHEVVNVPLEEVQPPKATEESSKDEAIIRAPKVELQGLKVLGKIELPQPKKKEAAQEETLSQAGADAPKQQEASPAPEKRISRDNKHRRERNNDRRPRKNPIALQREREQREAEERKKEEALREKEKRTQYYMSKVKPSAPVRAAKLVDEPLQHMDETVKEEPKTLWGKFIKWLTSY